MPPTENNHKLLLLGWAGADWRLIQPLLDAGRMPHLESLITSGVMGNLHTLTPPEAPALWASIATGRRADTHGILGKAMPSDDRLGVRPADSTDLRALPLWQILSDAGKKAAAVGWPATHPADVFDALVVSDAFAEASGNDFDNWPLRANCVSDAELRATMADLRLHPTEVTPEQVLPFIPRAAQIDQETDERLTLLMVTLARAASIHAAGTWVAEQTEWDLLAVHFDLIERLSAAFIQYRAPRMPHVSAADFEIYQEVVDGAYQFMDLLLGRYLELVAPDTHVMLVSDHGFLADQLRAPAAARNVGEKIARQYREFGILVCSGPGLKRDELVFGANLLDVAPTSLALLGVPLSRELEGRVLMQMFEASVEPDYQASYPAPDWQARANGWKDADWAEGRIAELVVLGYLPHPASNSEEAAEQATIQGLNNLASVLIAKREHRAALAALEELLQLFPEHTQARVQVAQCWFALGDTQRCRAALDDMVESGRRGAMIDYLYGQLCVKEGDLDAAQAHLQCAEEGGIGGRRLLERIGHVHLQAKQWSEAELSFRKALDIDPDFALAHHGLGMALAAQVRHDEAVEHLLWSIGLLYHQAGAHFALGLSLAALGHHLHAIEAVSNALEIQPELPGAEKVLQRLRRKFTKQMIDADRISSEEKV